MFKCIIIPVLLVIYEVWWNHLWNLPSYKISVWVANFLPHHIRMSKFSCISFMFSIKVVWKYWVFWFHSITKRYFLIMYFNCSSYYTTQLTFFVIKFANSVARSLSAHVFFFQISSGVSFTPRVNPTYFSNFLLSILSSHFWIWNIWVCMHACMHVRIIFYPCFLKLSWMFLKGLIIHLEFLDTVMLIFTIVDASFVNSFLMKYSIVSSSKWKAFISFQHSSNG